MSAPLRGVLSRLSLKFADPRYEQNINAYKLPEFSRIVSLNPLEDITFPLVLRKNFRSYDVVNHLGNLSGLDRGSQTDVLRQTLRESINFRGQYLVGFPLTPEDALHLDYATEGINLAIRFEYDNEFLDDIKDSLFIDRNTETLYCNDFDLTRVPSIEELEEQYKVGLEEGEEPVKINIEQITNVRQYVQEQHDKNQPLYEYYERTGNLLTHKLDLTQDPDVFFADLNRRIMSTIKS